ncbi:hypothetical protein DPMN_185703 [Dreissena polymorpha]|uniref:Uncharacterized protein n=1 Tax=Dreissena polymorpha TaxID=45954 RepID=A0A9D4DME3_DREPO|nr:hypothetical protein DPMN_185703 [Dreissena polymorpha]
MHLYNTMEDFILPCYGKPKSIIEFISEPSEKDVDSPEEEKIKFEFLYGPLMFDKATGRPKTVGKLMELVFYNLAIAAVIMGILIRTSAVRMPSLDRVAPTYLKLVTSSSLSLLASW